MLSLTSPRILHVATHGFFLGGNVPEDPLQRCGIALAGANGAGEAIVTARDLAGVDLSGTELVTLSACDTALGVSQAGEGVLGLARGAFLAGARAVVLSLWPVPDQVTADLMTLLYADLATGTPPAAALRSAQLAVRATGVGWRGWGGFVCVQGPVARG